MNISHRQPLNEDRQLWYTNIGRHHFDTDIMKYTMTDQDKMHYFRAFLTKKSEIQKDANSPFSLVSTTDIPTLCRFYLLKDQFDSLLHFNDALINLSTGCVEKRFLDPTDLMYAGAHEKVIHFYKREMYANHVAQASLLFFGCTNLSSNDTFELIARSLFLEHAVTRFNTSKDITTDMLLTEPALKLHALIVFRSVFGDILQSRPRDWTLLLQVEPRWSLACPPSQWHSIKHLLSEPEYEYMQSVHLNYGHMSPVMTSSEYLEATWFSWPSSTLDADITYDYF